LQLPNGVVIERIWMFVDGLKEEQFFDIENYLVKVPRTSMKSMVLTNRGLFVAERRASLPVNHINQALLNQLLMVQLKALIAEATAIKARLSAYMEKK
jgi:hypothetical protein